VLIRAKIERGIGGVDRARQRTVGGIDVLVEFLVVGGDGPVPDRQSILEIVLNDGHAGLHVGARDVERGAAVEYREVAVRRERRRRIEPGRAAGRRLRGIAAIGRALVVKIFVAQFDLGVVVGLQRHRRIDAVALDRAEIAKRIGAFVERVEANGDIFVDGLPGIEREAAIVP
jgi:hypothetical protein